MSALVCLQRGQNEEAASGWVSILQNTTLLRLIFEPFVRRRRNTRQPTGVNRRAPSFPDAITSLLSSACVENDAHRSSGVGFTAALALPLPGFRTKRRARAPPLRAVNAICARAAATESSTLPVDQSINIRARAGRPAPARACAPRTPLGPRIDPSASVPGFVSSRGHEGRAAAYSDREGEPADAAATVPCPISPSALAVKTRARAPERAKCVRICRCTSGTELTVGTPRPPFGAPSRVVRLALPGFARPAPLVLSGCSQASRLLQCTSNPGLTVHASSACARFAEGCTRETDL
ncbi:hypothetical protein MTO96_023407 [Rhipicephalus appendiculatus]